MKLAFCLYKYFPFGGLQRDFLRIAQACLQRGHEVVVYTMRWEGEVPAGLQVRLLKAQGWQNHTRAQHYVRQVKHALAAEKFDLVVGFNKMPHLDLYYAADVCYQARLSAQRSPWHRFLPRCRHHIAFERSVFASSSQTNILLIAPRQQREFEHYYQTPADRFHHLPPGIGKDRIAPPDAADIRARVRDNLHIADDVRLVLMVGSGFKTKGLDRAIAALAALPSALKSHTQLIVIGQDNAAPFQALALAQGVAEHVHFLGGRPDVPDFLLAADCLLHPAYHENTGTVLLEAVVSGLPVLTVDVCGYAHYIQDANAGIVLASPFDQAALNKSLEKMLCSSERDMWRQNALAFAKQADIYSMPDKAADIIEQTGQKRATVFA